MSAQSLFHAALLDADRDIPSGLIDSAGNVANARFGVYRNTVVVSLRDALTACFPILAKLLGPQNFMQLAGIYRHQYPPKSPLMMFYGDDMPQLLDTFAPLQHIGYLADVARLEIAMRRSYHAADATPIDPAALQQLSAETLTQTVLTFAPATALIQSNWPLYDIWRFNSVADTPAPQAIAQSALITRTQFDPTPHPLTAAQYAWTASVQNGETLGQAYDHATLIEPNFDLSSFLALLLNTGCIDNFEIEGARP